MDEPTQEDFERMERDEYYNKNSGCLGIVILFVLIAGCSLYSCNTKSKYDKAVEGREEMNRQLDSIDNANGIIRPK